MRRVKKAPAVRRAELIDTAQVLFLTRGYERTTINDVINATGLSKGAFYHHFRSKEDLLEAIAGRFARDSLGFIENLQADVRLNALERLNMLLSLGREWKREHLAELREMFTTLLRPENAVLYHRIVGAVFEVLIPAVASIIADGQTEGVFDVGDPRVAADTLLWLSNGRRQVLIDALARAGSDLEGAVDMVVVRVRAEEQITKRILGLTGEGVDLLGPEALVREMLADWAAGERRARRAAPRANTETFFPDRG